MRTPRWEDLDDLLELINSLVEEGAEIDVGAKTRDEEANWLAGALIHLEKGEELYVVAEVDGKVIASSSLEKSKFHHHNHVGNLGIIIKSGYRDVGIGSEMIKTMIAQARPMGLKILTLTVHATNKRAIHVYRKVGFKETGQIPMGIYRNGKYIDNIIMTKILT